MSEITNYGCHCMFGAKWRHGRSKPVNIVDSTCKDLAMCYKCVFIDHDVEAIPGDCDTVTESYTGPSLIQVQNKGIFQACSDENAGDICKTRTCSCDTNFVYRLIEIFFDATSFDEQPQHDQNGFDFENECPRRDDAGSLVKECCGTYPKRFPFGLREGQRACCVDRTYNPFNLNCCGANADGEGILQISIC